MPFGGKSCTGWNIDDSRWEWSGKRVDTAIANDVVRGNIRDRTVVGWHTDTSVVAGRDTVHVELLKDSMSRSGCGKKDWSKCFGEHGTMRKEGRSLVSAVQSYLPS